jgi:glutamine synthetase
VGALDAAGPGVAEYFAALKRAEFLEWHSTVGSWELDRYLTAF